MAATGLRTALVLLTLPLLRADQAADVRSQVETIARSLSAGDPAAAIAPFDKSYPQYDKLSDDFGGLTGAFEIVNNVDVADEEDTAAESKLTVHWTITLSDLQSHFTQQRVGDINVRLVLKGRKWKIVDFSPIEVFDPKPQPWPKP
ncbi:MAG TPA: hypothetical protein VHU83_20015 [Bryobacteraceae bacterium]|nr:hypothetical protein [Bryobacteraceae bacterium]